MDDEVRYNIDRPDEFSWTRKSKRAQFELTDWLVKKGVGKNAKQAGYLLIGVCIFCIVTAVFLFSSQGGRAKPPVPSIDGTFMRSS